MLDRLTERARKVMAMGEQEARRLNHEYLGVEHILLGLLEEGSGVGANVLMNLGVDLREVRKAVEKLVKPGPDMVAAGKLPQTPLAKKAMESAIEEARNLGHNYVGSEHLLLGLMRVEDGVAAKVIAKFGVTVENARAEVLSVLGAEPSAPRQAAAVRQFVITPAAGKRLIGKAMAKHPAILAVLKKGTLVIVAGTTNGYVAEEILAAAGQSKGFQRSGFRRGMTARPGLNVPPVNFPGDVVLVDGVWQKGKTLFDAADGLKEGDVILKGANAVNLSARQAAVQIGDPKAGTAGAALPAVVGRRVRLIVPVGLEKRISAELADLAVRLNSPGVEGPRLLPLPGEIFTELDAIKLLTGCEAELAAAGGVYGAEGAVWLAVAGSETQLAAAAALINSISAEPACEV